MTIQRWSPSNEGTFETTDGRYVLYTDHIAAMKEKDRDISDLLALSYGEHDALQLAVEQIAALQRWKDESLAVEESWDCQAVGKAIGIKLGGNIREGILPWVIAAKHAVATLQAITTAQTEYNTLELARIAHLQEKITVAEIEIDHQEQDNLTLQTKVKELEFYLDQLPAHNWHQKYEELQAEANRNMEELCKLRGKITALGGKI
jgi:hypothetical protein